MISVDKQGILNYWTGAKTEFQFPRNVAFESTLDTDLLEFAKQETFPVSLCFSPDGKFFATYGVDRKVSLLYPFSPSNIHVLIFYLFFSC